VRAANATTVVDAQRLVAEFRGFSGVRSAEIVSALTPVVGELDLLDRLPVGPAQWGQELRVEFSAAPARTELRAAAAEIAAAADRPAAVAMFLTCCTGRHPTGTVDLRLCTAAGQWRTIEVAARSFVDDAQVGAVAFFGIDVTRQRETERTVLVEQQRLARLVET